MDKSNNSMKKAAISKSVTSKDVAKAAGVSQSLVSLILNDVPDKKIRAETRQHVLEVARKMNYTINMNARNMRNRRSGAIGLLSTWSTSSFVYPPIINGVQDVCADNSLGVFICTGREDALGVKDYINYYKQNRIEGLIYISYVGVEYDGVIKELQDNGIPFVCIIGARDLPEISCVDVNFIENGYLAGKHLVEKGYKKILYLSYMKEGMGNYASNERLMGFKKCMQENNLEIHVNDELNDLTIVELQDKLKQIVASREYDAIVGLTYSCVIAIRSALQLGIKMPEELGVISLDNEHYAPYLYPTLTTIDEPFDEMARCAVNILLEKLNGSNVTKKIELNPSISVRQSTSR